MKESRVPQSPADFGQLQIAQPVIEGLLRILRRDLDLALQSVTPFENPLGEKCAELKIEAKDIGLGFPIPMRYPYLALFVRSTSYEYTGGMNPLINQVHAIDLDLGIDNQDQHCLNVALLRYQTAITRLILRTQAHVADWYATEPGRVGATPSLRLIRQEIFRSENKPTTRVLSTRLEVKVAEKNPPALTNC